MPLTRFRLPTSSPELAAGLELIRTELKVPTDFATDVQHAADAAAHRAVSDVKRIDARDIEFVTIDPEGSRDLDQAYFAEAIKDGFRVRYAIADVAAFVTAGDPVDLEAHARGVTLYLPDNRSLLHPSVLSEGAASLLAGEDRPAVLWTIDLDASGAPTTARLERALVRNRTALSYETVQHQLESEKASPSLQLLREIGKLREAQERARGGISIAVPTQEVTRVGDSYRLDYDAPLPVEGWNAQISLLAGICAAKIMIDGGIGILRTLPPPDDRAISRLRLSAKGLGVSWPDGRSYPDVVRDLDPHKPKNAAFLTQAVQTLRGAGYSLIGEGPPPVHGALATTYAHVTAPLRRLVDRYANETVVALCADVKPAPWVVDGLAALPEEMGRATQHAHGVERAVIDLVESLLLSTHVGDVFHATVVDLEHEDATVLIRDPAVIARVPAGGRTLGEQLDVKVVAADPAARKIELAPAAN
jgi:exoribonuclease R